MKTFPIADSLTLPLETVTEKLAFLGRTGSGKTYAAMKLAELMLNAGAQIGALDPVGVWRALRVPGPDGKAFEVYVFGGLYGDLPLEPTAGALIADVVCDRGISFVLDVSQFIPSEQQRFARAFADRFFQRKKAAPSAVHLFLEECQEFIPQNPMGDEALTLHAFQRLWKLGRNFGIGGSLISQRPQEISKKAFNMSGTLFAFQMTGPQERKAVREWVADHGIATDIESVLQKLRVGEPHVESPMFLEVSKTVRILPKITADLSSTPKVGASTAAKRPLTPIDVEQLKTALAATIEKTKADDPKELRRQIVELKRQVRTLELSKPEPVKPERVEVSVLTDTDREFLKELSNIAKVVVSDLENMLHVSSEIAAICQKATTAPAEKSSYKIPDKRQPERQPQQSRPAGHDSQSELGNSGKRRMLIALAENPAGITASKLSILTGISRTGGTFRTYIGALKQAGFVDGGSDLLRITQAGINAVGNYDPLPTGPDLIAYWQRELGDSGMKAIFNVLVSSYPRALSRYDIATVTGIAESGGTFRTYVGKLKTLELIEGRSELRASEVLFA